MKVIREIESSRRACLEYEFIEYGRQRPLSTQRTRSVGASEEVGVGAGGEQGVEKREGRGVSPVSGGRRRSQFLFFLNCAIIWH